MAAHSSGSWPFQPPQTIKALRILDSAARQNGGQSIQMRLWRQPENPRLWAAAHVLGPEPSASSLIVVNCRRGVAALRAADAPEMSNRRRLAVQQTPGQPDSIDKR